MVNLHLSEEEQVEELKKWWKENGKSIIAGVVLGLGGVFGWRAWVDYQDNQAAQAAARFEQLSGAVASGQPKQAEEIAKGLFEQYKGSSYTLFSALELAKAKVQQGDTEAAKAQLKWVLEQKAEPSLQQIARIRLARLHLTTGDLDATEALLKSAPRDAFRGNIAELMGDLALARGDRDAARAAYREALDNDVGNQAVVQMKLDDLADQAGNG